MSHFFVGVIVPPDTQDIEDEVEQLMEPYSENREVEPYERPCYCVGSLAKKEAREQAEQEVGSIEKFRATFLGGNDQAWRLHIKPYLDVENRALVAHPLKDKPDSGCEDCDGTGINKVTYNPDSKWDWYVIGGRWDGEIQGKPRDDGQGGFNFGDEHHQPQHNVTRVADLIKAKSIPDAVIKELTRGDDTFSCHSLVTPDGEWHEKGEMGWLGVSVDNKDRDTWLDEIQKILKEYADCLIVGVDCHI